MSKKMRKCIFLLLISSLAVSSTAISIQATAKSDTTKSDASNSSDLVKPFNTAFLAGQGTILKLQNNSSEESETKKGYTPNYLKSETVYVNLDAYGNIDTANVVNGYKLNGNTKIVDHGNYTNVTNLTNYARPSITGETIEWNLDNDLTEFYYQGTLKEAKLPWDVKVTYKLNGVEVPFEKLPGAKGMIETVIDVTPKKDADPYFKNNFLLQLSTSYDLSKCLSVEAPDAVVVTLGQTRSITFMAVPGETTTFHIYVGSDNYESSGLNIVMAPIKMTALSEITDLKDAKKRIEDAGDAASDSLDIILDSANSMKGGISSLSDGLQSLQSGIHAVRSQGVKNDAQIDKLMDSMNTFADSLDTLNPHLQTAQTLVGDTYSSARNIIQSFSNLKPQMESLKSTGETTKNDLLNTKHLLDDIQDAKKGLGDNIDSLNDDLKRVEQQLGNLSSSIDDMSDSLGDLHQSSSSASGAIGSGVAGGIQSGKIDPETGQLIGQITGGLQPSINNVSKDTNRVLDKATNLNSSLSGASASIRKLMTQLNDLNKAITKHEGEMDDALDNTGELIDNINETIDLLTDIINQAENTQQTLDLYEDDLKASLKDIEGINNNIKSFVQTSKDTANQLHQSIKDSRDGVYDGLDATFDGSTQSLQEALDALSKTDALKASKNIIKDTIDNEWDRLDDDYNLLDIDPDAKPVSFASADNPSPDSVQIILKTPEVSLDDTDDVGNLEPEEENLSIWEKIKRIFLKLIGKSEN